MICDNCDDARDVLYDKYEFIINLVIKKYKSRFYYFGIEYGDIKQEALLGFNDALINYDSSCDTSLPTYISVCIERRLIDYLRSLSRKKKLDDSFSLDEYEDFSLLDFIGDDKYNPSSLFLNAESYLQLYNKIDGVLSPVEHDVFLLIKSGYSKEDIYKILGIDDKKFSNTLHRIKQKIRDIVA